MFQFPPNPAVGQTFNPVAGVTFRWNGTAWFLLAGPGAFISQAEADLRYVELSDPRPPVNAIINGDFRVWQRGNGPYVSTVGAAIFTADRWAIGNTSGPAVVQGARETANLPTFAQAGRVFADALFMLTTTPNPAPAASDIVEFHQTIEGYQWANLAQRPIVLSFWVQTGIPGIYSVALYNPNAPAQYCIMEYTVLASNTWERKVVNFPASPASGVWNYTNGSGAFLFFPMHAGSTYQAAPGVWGSGVKLASPNQGNMTNPVNNYMRLTGVDLRPGTEAPAVFESRPFAEELALCQRYFAKSYNMADAPGAITPTAAQAHVALSAAAQANYIRLQFPARMRAAPTVTLYSPVTGATGVWRNNNAGADLAMQAGLGAAAEVGQDITNSAAVGALNLLYGHWTASAEL